MHFHWVSQNQTGNHEVSGGYMWCPKSNVDGSRNVNYEMMRDSGVGIEYPSGNTRLWVM
jgi:hypothetical protein